MEISRFSPLPLSPSSPSRGRASATIVRSVNSPTNSVNSAGFAPTPPPSIASFAESRKRGRPSKHATPYACTHCNASFQRQEHLNRHAAAHDQLKLHGCEACGKRFSRGDVLTRHYRTCKVARSGNYQFRSKSLKTRRACQLCNEAKSKCTGGPRCQRCTNLGLQCKFIHRERQKSTAPPPPLSSSNNIGDVGTTSTQNTGPDLFDSQDSHFETEPASTEAVHNEMSFTIPDSQARILPDDRRGRNLDLAPAAPDVRPADEIDALMFHHTPDSFLDASFQLDQFDFAMIQTLFADPMEHQSHEVHGDYLDTLPDDQSSYMLPGAPPAGNNASEMRDAVPTLPSGLNIGQLDPLEGHRVVILDFLHTAGLSGTKYHEVLSSEKFRLFLWSYFSHFHQHTPLLHLPRWSVATTSSSLLFAMALIGAKYSENIGQHDGISEELCGAANRFVWSSYQGHNAEENCGISLEDLQALYLLALLDTCYFPNKRPTGTDFRRLIDAARAGGYFEEIADLIEMQFLSWDDWIFQESRRRTAFTIFLLDAMRAVFFGERPYLTAYEMRLRLPCHENVFRATNPTEWKVALDQCDDLTTFQFPIIISSLLSITAVNCIGLYSVMGSFIVLHGILVFIWERQQFDNRSRGVGNAESEVIRQLAKENNEVAEKALYSWGENWNRTVSNPLSSMSSGLYRDRAIAYWFLGRLLNSQDRKQIQLTTGRRLEMWSMRIPRIMKHLIIKLDRGQLDESENIRDLQAECLNNDAYGEHENSREGMDLLNIRFIMNRKRG